MKSISEIIHDISGVFHKLFNSLPKWVMKVMPDILATTTAIRNALKQGEDWLKSQTADTIVALIPGTTDDTGRAWLIAILDQALVLVDKAVVAEHSLGDKLKTFLESLHNETDKGAKAKLMAVASTMLRLNDEDKLAESIYDSFSQLAYSKLKADAAETSVS